MTIIIRVKMTTIDRIAPVPAAVESLESPIMLNTATGATAHMTNKIPMVTRLITANQAN